MDYLDKDKELLISHECLKAENFFRLGAWVIRKRKVSERFGMQERLGSLSLALKMIGAIRQGNVGGLNKLTMILGDNGDPDRTTEWN